jgi:hypothetical protein
MLHLGLDREYAECSTRILPERQEAGCANGSHRQAQLVCTFVSHKPNGLGERNVCILGFIKRMSQSSERL